MATIEIVEGVVLGLSLAERTISGVVLDADLNPVSREVIVVVPGRNEVMGRTVSDAVTGAYSIIVNVGPREQATVIAFGADGENSQAMGHIVGDLP